MARHTYSSTAFKGTFLVEHFTLTVKIPQAAHTLPTSTVTINHTHRRRIVAETSANRTNFPLQSAKTNYRRRFRRKPYHENGKSMSLYYSGVRK